TTISQLRAQGDLSSFGDETDAVVRALTEGFADGTRWSIAVATIFLALGFVGALRLRRASATSQQPSTKNERFSSCERNRDIHSCDSTPPISKLRACRNVHLGWADSGADSP